MLYGSGMRLGAKIKAALDARGRSQADVARAIDCSQAQLSAVIKRNSSKSVLVQPVARELQIPVEWFLTDDDSPVPRPDGGTDHVRNQSKPLSVQEQAMDFEKAAALLVQAWKALPENERDEVLQQVNVRSMKYRSRTPDQQLDRLAAPGTEPAKKAAKKSKAGTQ